MSTIQNLKNFIRHGKQARAPNPPHADPTTTVTPVHAQQQRYQHAAPQNQNLVTDPNVLDHNQLNAGIVPRDNYSAANVDNRNVVAQAGGAAAKAAADKQDKIARENDLDPSVIERIVAEERESRGKLPKYPGLERWTLLEKMGDGAFSNVYRAKDNTNQLGEVAIKVVRKFEMNNSQAETHLHPDFKKKPKVVERANILKEVQIMRQIDHSNIVQLIDFSESRQYYYIVLELCPGGELFHQIVRLTYFSEDLSRHVIVQVAQALEYLHEVGGVVHRDIKPENLLFYPIPFIPTRNPKPKSPEDEEKVDEGEFIKGLGAGGIGKIKIADFGLSKVIWDSQTMTPCGTVGYTAPEIVKDERYSKSVDMWALGCVLYTLLCGFPPFYDESIQILTEKVARGHYTFLSPWWDDISKSAQDLVSHLLTVDPDKRYTIQQFLQHPWIKESDEETDSAADAPPLATPLYTRQKEYGFNSKIPDHQGGMSALLETPGGGRRMDFRSPGAVNLREVFDVSYAVHRQEEEGKRRKNFPQGYRGAAGLSGLNPLNEDDDDDYSDDQEDASNISQNPPSKLPKPQGGTADVTGVEQKMRTTNLGHSSAAAQARQAAAPRKAQQDRGYGQHSPAVAAAAKQQVRRQRGAFELSLDNATLLGRRGKGQDPTKLREQLVQYTETDTTAADQSALMETSSGDNNKRSKSRRKYKAAIEGLGRQQEQLKEQVPLNGESIPASEDEIAASITFSAVNVNGKDNMKADSRNEAHQVTDKGGKLKRPRYEFRAQNGKFTARDRDDGSSKRARLNKSINTVKRQTALLPSSLSTNDVTMEDSGASPKTQTVVQPKPIMQRLLAEADNEQSDAPTQPSDRLPSLIIETPQRQNHLKERKDQYQSQSRVEPSDAAAQEQPNHPDFPLPIDSVSTNEPIPVGKSTVAHRHEKANQQHYIKAATEATGDVVSDVDMSRGPIDQPEGVGGDEQNRNPETEDLSLFLLPDSESFNEWSLNSDDSDESTSKARKGKMTPPPLAKPSKPLGNKKQQGGKKAKNYDPPLDMIAKKGGVWTEAEISRLETFRDNYCKENDLSTFQFNALVHSFVRYDEAATALFNELHETFPYRTRMSAMRVCRRRFHNFPARGTWTQSEDESLKQAVSEKGRSWKAVGEMINRFPEDCRDRYRNYHVNAQNRNRESWTDAEILNLCRAVHDCMAKMKGNSKQAKLKKFVGREVPESESESDEEVRDMKLINWQIVSDAMGPGGGRSRLQCSLKWAQLRMVERAKYMKRVNDALRGRSPTENGTAKKPKRENWRARRAQRTLNNMKTGDRFDFLQALATCNAREEENIAWKLLGDEAFRSRWTVTERKAALQRFKNEVPESNNMNYHDVVNRLLTKLMAESSHRLGERWERGLDPDVNVERRKQRLAEEESRREGLPKESRRKGLPKESRRKGLPKEGRRKGLSKEVEDEKVKSDEFVISRDDEEQEYDVQEATEDKGTLSNESDAYNEAEVEMPNENMSAEASNRNAQEGRTNSAIDAHTNRSSARDASSRLIVASAYEEALEALPDRNANADLSASIVKGLGPSDSVAIGDRTREDLPEDVGFGTGDDSLSVKGSESPEPDEAAEQDPTQEAQEALSDNGSDDVTPARTATGNADEEIQADSSDGEVIDATPARKGEACADDARDEGSSKEEATDAVTPAPQSNTLPVVYEAPANDRLHDRLPDEDMMTDESPLSEIPESHDDGDDDDDVRTDSDVDSLFGKPLAG